MRRQTAARPILQTQGPVAFHPVHIDDFTPVEHTQIAGLANGFDQITQNGAHRTQGNTRRHRVQAQVDQFRADGETVAPRQTPDQRQIFHLTENAVHGLARQIQPIRQFRQAKGPFGARQQVQNRHGFFQGRTRLGHTGGIGIEWHERTVAKFFTHEKTINDMFCPDFL